MKYLTLLVATLFVSTTFAHENESRQAKVITTEKGDKITMSPIPDRQMNIANKRETVTTTIDKPKPVYLNGNEIFYFKDHPNWKELIEDAEAYKRTFEEYHILDNHIDDAIAQAKEILDKGDYKFMAKNVVINEEGRIVYYETNGLTKYTQGVNQFVNDITLEMDKKQADIINSIIIDQIEKARFTPLVVNKAATPYLTNINYYLHKK